MALGALEALKESKRNATVVGINGIVDAVRLIEAGSIVSGWPWPLVIRANSAARALCVLPNRPDLQAGSGRSTGIRIRCIASARP